MIRAHGSLICKSLALGKILPLLSMGGSYRGNAPASFAHGSYLGSWLDPTIVPSVGLDVGRFTLYT